MGKTLKRERRRKEMLQRETNQSTGYAGHQQMGIRPPSHSQQDEGATEIVQIKPVAKKEHQAIIACCDCGCLIEPNPSNMCAGCLSKRDITDGIPTEGALHFCRSCERYLQPPATWIKAQLESKELLTICLKKLPGLRKVRLVDASFIWTEPHSKRIKIKLTIQKEVFGTVLQQVFEVQFIVFGQMCDSCHRVEAKDFWNAKVQIRQKAEHKKTVFYLEQLILRYKAHSNTINIASQADGIDFCYSTEDHARKMVAFVSKVVPSRYTTAKELKSHDSHNNTYNYKRTFSVEIVPLCKDNILCLPVKVAQKLGSINQLVICQRVTQTIHLICPSSLQRAELSSEMYWQNPFTALVGPSQMTEFTVINVERVDEKDMPHCVRMSVKHMLVDVWVSRTRDLGVTDKQFHTRSHLGHILNSGDTVLGFDFTCSNLNHEQLEKMSEDRIPDVILVKKVYNRPRRCRRRNWKLRRLVTEDAETNDNNFTEFQEDLEEDADLRKKVNIYKDNSKVTVEAGAETDDGEDVPTISLEEMLDDLCLEDNAEEEEDALMA